MQVQTILDEADARAAIEAIRAEALKRGKSAVIAVCDAQGELIAFTRMDGAPVSSVNVAINKAFTSARLRRPSSLIGQNVRRPETGFFIGYYGDSRYTGFSGGMPVKVEERIAGSIGVSGLTEAEDEELAQIGIAAIFARLT